MTRYIIYLFIVVVLFSCRRPYIVDDFRIPKGKAAAGEVSGSANWKAGYSYSDATGTQDTAYVLPDTTFEIVYLKDSTVRIGNLELIFIKYDSVVKAGIFLPTQPMPQGTESYLQYNTEGQTTFVKKNDSGSGQSTYTYTTHK